MAYFGDHLKPALLINGSYQATLVSLSAEFDSGAQRVDTVEGLAGKTPGSGSVTLNVTVTVPVGGTEYDFLGSLVDGDYIDMQVPFGAKSYIGTGWIQNATMSGGANANTEASFTWIGKLDKPA